MGFGCSSKPFFIFLSFLIFFTNLELYPLVESAPDYTTLVYKGCAKQSFTDPARIYSQALSALFQTLLSQSMKVKFYKTTTRTGQTTITIMGTDQSVYLLGQCEGDVGDSDCGEYIKSVVQRAQVECFK
ncbi:hypothetical protein Gogos_004911 [Gossypium gossypioides]|uniref:Gnk2-homologous domain-containing protein n=1 Tax=Gossypium gossypioides TaxID=34282 RepID=A0A7J9CHZ7_GOSGO|nr:hypothetical protein [Gossypium gossypioides]